MKIFFCALSLFLFCAATAQRVKIPIDTSRWYQLNETSGNLAKLFDGNKDTRAFTGWSNVLPTYDAYYPLQSGEAMTVDSVRIYDKEGIFTSAPMRLYAITDTWERKLIATFTGDFYNVWVGPYPSRYTVFKLDTPVTNIRYLQLNITNNNFPGEIELYGTYTPSTPVAALPLSSPAPLKNMLGINGFPWNLTAPACTWCVDSVKLKAMTSFRGIRTYLDWSKMEETEGRYTFSPLMGGGWHLDTVYKRLKAEGIEILPTLQNIPAWMMATYPDSLKTVSNNPVRYGKELTDPLSYIEQARLGFQFAARYGKNKNIDPSLVSVYTVPLWTNAKVNEKKIGLGLVNYIECNNEQNKWWIGRRGYLSGREYAASLSAFYDGHKNTMGAATGVKNADSSLLVVMGGLASSSTDYIRGMIDWCKEFRGYKADGSVNLCFDVVNYHLYNVDVASQASYITARGAAPELSNAAQVAKSFVQMSAQLLNNMPVWVTEQGYDINQGSPYNAIPVENKTALQTQADWVLRSALLYAREGVQAGFFYRAYDEDTASTTKFASMGLLNKGDYSRKPAADFLYQTANLFGDYRYRQTLNADPIVDRYERAGQNMFAVMVPDDKGRTATCSLALPGTDSVFLYTPLAGSDTMAKQKLAVASGQLQLTVTETPQFVVPVPSTQTGAASRVLPGPLTAAAETETPQFVVPVPLTQTGAASRVLPGPLTAAAEMEAGPFASDVQVYPNPARDALIVKNKGGGKWKIVILTLQGREAIKLDGVGHSGLLSLQHLAAGIYPLYMLNGKGERVFSRFIVKI